MYNLSDIKTVKQLLSNYGFKFSKSLGQNFIISPRICPKMAEQCISSERTKVEKINMIKKVGVIEIGPGIGVLTAELAKRFEKVVSVEIDKDLIPILLDTTSEFKNVKIINNDILKIDLADIVANELGLCDEIHICANLPYYITSEVIMHVLESNLDINSIVVMVQKEAATRICAQPGSRDSGAISLAVRYYGTPKIVFEVGRGCFIPAPNVDSAVIKIVPDKSISRYVLNKDMYFKVIRAAYGKRRKNILNSLSMGLALRKGELESLLASLGISKLCRAEELQFEDFANIANALCRIKQGIFDENLVK